ncbi:MAG: toxin-antitoxin system HicB family antitoxin [Polyangiales bacterium]
MLATLQVKNIPDALYAELQQAAEAQGQTLAQWVLCVLQTHLERHPFLMRWQTRTPVMLPKPAADVLAEVRAEQALERE